MFNALIVPASRRLAIRWRLLLAGFFAVAVFSETAGAQSLPDFTQLVEHVTPAVVNVETVAWGQRSETDQDSEESQIPEQDIPELFRRFFEPYGPRRPRSEPDRRTGGSGFIIAPDGYIVTNHHVIDGADEITVRLADRREYQAKLIGSDEASDIALLKVEAEDLPTLPFGDSSRLKPGEWVIAIGSPFNFEQTVTAGIVSAKGRTNSAQQYVPFIQTDVAINRGNSGGPLIDMQGEVVGINSWILSSSGGYIGLSFSIPSEVAQSTIAQLREQGFVARGLLGVGIEDLSLDKAKALGLDRPRGALVNRIEKDSAAEKAGVEAGDVILEFNGQPIERFNDLPPLVGSTPPGTKVDIVVHRWGKQKTLHATLSELPAPDTALARSRAGGGESDNLLGIRVRDLDDTTRQQLGDPEGGVLVTAVDGTAAYRAGLRRGDLIMMINNQKIADVASFRELVAGLESGKTVALLISRNGQTTFLAFTPDEVE